MDLIHTWIPVIQFLDFETLLTVRLLSKSFKDIVYKYGILQNKTIGVSYINSDSSNEELIKRFCNIIKNSNIIITKIYMIGSERTDPETGKLYFCNKIVNCKPQWVERQSFIY